MGSPVSASWKAWCFSSSSSWCCSVTSRRVKHQAGDGRLVAQVAAPGLDVDAPAVAAGDPLVHVRGSSSRASARSRMKVRARSSRSPSATRSQARSPSTAIVTEDRWSVDGVAYLTGPVVADDHDGVRGVLDQGAEVGLVALADHLLAEHDALQRQGHLVRQDLQRRREVGQDALLAEYRDQSDQRITRRPVLQRQRAEQHPLGRRAGPLRAWSGSRLTGVRIGAGPLHQRQPGLGQLPQLLIGTGSAEAVGQRAERAVDPHREQRVALRVRAEQGADRVRTAAATCAT